MSAIPLLRRAIDTRAVEHLIDRTIAEGRLAGAVVLAVYRGQPLFAKAAGVADRERDVPMQQDTLFRLASVSKPLVTATAMALVGRGALELDQPIHRWLAEFRPRLADGRTPDITLRQLLTHTAGLGYRFLEEDTEGPFARAGVSDGMDDSAIDLKENLRRIASVPLLFEPGTSWRYSIAVDVVGGLIEAATGMALPEAVRQLIATPIGIVDTDFHAVDATRLAQPYVLDNEGLRLLREGDVVTPFEGAVGIMYSPARATTPSAFPSGGAGMVGTAPDMLRFLEALRQEKHPGLSPMLIAEMARNQVGQNGPPDAPGFGFGLGFSVLRDAEVAQTPEAAGTWRWGGAYGHSWFVDVARQLTVVAFTNTLYEGMSGRFVSELRDVIYAAIDAERAS
ncbi:CubicO group peptidase (beta-lactamase class C family) [Luteibacter sp. Sphag1AF]|uniref:serine hydrolase domain-containing protein n=1 Tax=Luteibacter sp. Sphag1AF TaxID=2587031 RepID=UPI00160C5E0E|nr:serine hydrolase domain-containing protein [Luteibacter sp. Sphag1AF]MBB3226539.1 CubicO group peptidase (beta-lactamase class C family) [Luteibacter sp. Sphag1AF]